MFAILEFRKGRSKDRGLKEFEANMGYVRPASKQINGSLKALGRAQCCCTLSIVVHCM